jgi:hypothetical protein
LEDRRNQNTSEILAAENKRKMKKERTVRKFNKKKQFFCKNTVHICVRGEGGGLLVLHMTNPQMCRDGEATAHIV